MQKEVKLPFFPRIIKRIIHISLNGIHLNAPDMPTWIPALSNRLSENKA